MSGRTAAAWPRPCRQLASAGKCLQMLRGVAALARFVRACARHGITAMRRFPALPALHKCTLFSIPYLAREKRPDAERSFRWATCGQVPVPRTLAAAWRVLTLGIAHLGRFRRCNNCPTSPSTSLPLPSRRRGASDFQSCRASNLEQYIVVERRPRIRPVACPAARSQRRRQKQGTCSGPVPVDCIYSSVPVHQSNECVVAGACEPVRTRPKPSSTDDLPV